MAGVTREQAEIDRGLVEETAAPHRGLVGWFRHASEATAAVDALGGIGVSARRVQRAAHPEQLEPDRRRWMLGGAVGVTLGAVLGLLAGAYLGTAEGAVAPLGSLLVSAVVGALIVGSLGLFAGFGFGRNRARRPRVGQPPGERVGGGAPAPMPDTVVYAELPEASLAAATRALRDAGAYAVEPVRPGEEPPPEARETPAGS